MKAKREQRGISSFSESTTKIQNSHTKKQTNTKKRAIGSKLRSKYENFTSETIVEDMINSAEV